MQCVQQDGTPTKVPNQEAALVSQSAAAHAAPVQFYGSHRVFLAPRTVGMPYHFLLLAIRITLLKRLSLLDLRA